MDPAEVTAGPVPPEKYCLLRQTVNSLAGRGPAVDIVLKKIGVGWKLKPIMCG